MRKSYADDLGASGREGQSRVHARSPAPSPGTVARLLEPGGRDRFSFNEAGLGEEIMIGRATFWRLFAALLIFGAHAANATDAALVAAATKEGTVRWYTVILVEEAVKPLVAAFEARYPGIKVDYTRANTPENARKVIAEAKAGKVEGDVFDGSTTAAPLMEAGLIEPYKADSARDIPDQYKDPDGYWTALLMEYLVPGYNTDLVALPDVPKSYADLLDPKWRGKIIWAPNGGLTGGAGFAADVVMAMGRDAGLAYLEKLKGQQLVALPGDGNSVAKELEKGRYPLALQIFNHHTVIERAKGAHIDWIKLEPVLSFSNNIGLIKNAPHPNAGKLLIDFILSVEGQMVIRNANHIPASSKVEAAVPSLKSGFATNYISPAVAVKRNAEWQALYDQVFK